MNQSEIFITDIDFDCKLWKNYLLYKNKEAQLYLNRIEELLVVTSNSTHYTILEELELAFFDFKKRVLRIMNRIRIFEEEIAMYAEDYPINQNHTHFIEHETARSRIRLVEEISMQLTLAFEPFVIQ